MYTLNQADASEAIWQNLKLGERTARRKSVAG
jgi:hypothetical protein